MKNVKRLSLCLLALCVLLSLVAPTAVLADDHNHGKQNPKVKARYFGDGSVEYETTDPFGNEVTVVIDPKIENPINDPRDDPWSKNFRGFEIEEMDQPGFRTKATVTVPVYAVADEEYRAAHANWQDVLYQIIETADNAYYRDFGINWVINGYYSWSSQGSNASAILNDLTNDGAGLPDGLCQGFTDDSNFNAGGIAWVYNSNPGTGYSVCLDQGTSSTTYALRHEIGHNYGASHDFGSTVCMMNYSYSYSVDYFEANPHESMVNSRRNWF